MSYLGIDLGTTNSVAVIYRDKDDSVCAVTTDGTDEILPSVVSYVDDEIIVGSEAKSGAVIYPENTVISIKRLIGTSNAVNVGEFSRLPEEISAEILKKLKEAAEEQAKESFDEVVITHPAYFNDRQIYATKQAGLIAGFKNVYLLSEPLAAAIEYGYRQGYAQTILVYDIGGGTFDACVLKVSIGEDGQEIFQELSDVGDMSLGGDDFDNEIINFIKDRFNEETGINLEELEDTEKRRVEQKLKQEAEQAKKKLSGTNKVSIKINPIIIKDGVPKNISFEISRDEFESMIRKYVEKSREIVGEALKRAGKEPDEISKVILVGGSTLIPMVKRMVAGYIKEPYRATDPAKSVAMGAAIYNHLIHLPNCNVHVGQVTRQIFGTEAIVDLKTMKKSLIPIIPMGTLIPCSILSEGYTNLNGASMVNVNVYQWEQGCENEKKYIGSVLLSGITEFSDIEITYVINENNLFEVHVKDKVTGKIEKNEFDRTKAAVEPEQKNYVFDKSQNINIVFTIDTTGSMDSYINGVKERAIEFSNILNERGVSFKFGLIGFGDLNEKEKPSVYGFTNDIAKFQKQVKHIPRTYGGDIPESSLDALETSIELLKSEKSDENSKNIFILITDAPPHIPTNSGKSIEDIRAMLKDNEVTTYVAARRDRESRDAYEPLVAGGGKYYDLNEKFYDILDNIAMSIAELVKL
ncbi:MAG: Hsp70 family protein [Clostridiales bacterium]|nr:Hsp70 family protein [Clostridiales bacterium]